MSRHAVKLSAREVCQLDLLAALEIQDKARPMPWRPAALALVVPRHYTFSRTCAELLLVVCALPLLWLIRRRLRE
jgi:hypothetical protein